MIKHVYYNMSYVCSLTIPFNILSNECFQFACTIASLPGAWKKWKGAPGTLFCMHKVPCNWWPAYYSINTL